MDFVPSSPRPSPTLVDLLTQPRVEPLVVQDCLRVIEREVAKPRGLLGLITAQGFQALRNFDQGQLLTKVMAGLLSEFAQALDPYYQRYQIQRREGKAWGSAADFVAYMQRHDRAVAEALLAITDRRRQKSYNPLLNLTYDNLRKPALGLVQDGVPAIAQVIATYALK
jgi:hypothetical protein